MMTRLIAAFVCVLTFACSTVSPLRAEEHGALNVCSSIPNVPDDTLKVAIRKAPPFISEHAIHGLTGISVDLWEHIAQHRDYDFAYVCLSHPETIAALKSGKIDLTISPLTISSTREEAFDFSHQYFNSRLVFSGPPEATGFNFERILETLWNVVASKTFLIGAAVILAIIIGITTFGIRYARYYMPERLAEGRRKETFWLHMVLFAMVNTLGIEKSVWDFGTVPLQAFTLVVSLLGAGLSASVGGILTASIVNSTETGSLQPTTTQDLAHTRFSTLEGSTAAKHLTRRLDRSEAGDPSSLRERRTWAAALEDIKAGRADRVLGDWVQLIYLSNQDRFRDHVQVSDATVQFEPYGWGLPTGSPLIEPINQEIMKVLRSPEWPEVVHDHVGSEILTNR